MLAWNRASMSARSCLRWVRGAEALNQQPATAVPGGDAESGARTVFGGFARWTLFAAFALIVIFRLPKAWTHGRFQDEEATVFLAYAWHYHWAEALFRPFAGYWNMGANATTVALVQLVRNGLLSLERAPYFTMVIALAVQLLPAVLILTGRAPWLAGRLAVIAALLLIATRPATEEVFFNVLHIQFHLALCVALILAMDVPRRWVPSLGYAVLLILAPLCGPGAIVLLPLFALRALADRDPGRLKQMAILAAGAAVQMLWFYGSSPVRGQFVDFSSIAPAMFVRLITLPTAGVEPAYRVASAIHGPEIAGASPVWLFTAATMLLLAALAMLVTQRRDASLWLMLSSLLIAFVTFGLGIATALGADVFDVGAGQRYNFLPAVLLGLALVALAMRPDFRGKTICAALCAMMLVVGAYHYPRPDKAFADGPSWPAEVRAWRSDHDHPLAVWPRPWAADLSDRARPCSPRGRDAAGSNDPRYCENGWVASFYPRQRRMGPQSPARTGPRAETE